MKIISWNIDRKDEAWRQLLKADADIALLQEARRPPTDVAQAIEIDVDDLPWRLEGPGERMLGARRWSVCRSRSP